MRERCAPRDWPRRCCLVCLPVGWARGQAARQRVRERHSTMPMRRREAATDRMANRTGSADAARRPGKLPAASSAGGILSGPAPQQAYAGRGARPGYGAGGYGQPGYNGRPAAGLRRAGECGQRRRGGTWKTGSISTGMFLSRTRSGCCSNDPSFRRLAPADQQTAGAAVAAGGPDAGAAAGAASGAE